MKKLLLLAAFAAACVSGFAQTTQVINTTTPATYAVGTANLPLPLDTNGKLVTSGGGSGGGDASAANQVLQLAQETTAATQTTTTATQTTAINAKFGSLGQKAMSGSAPVVISSDQAAIPVTSTPGTSVTTDLGLTRFRTTALTNTAQAVKASAGNLYGIKLINPNTTPAYVKIYNIAAASVTVGSSTPVAVLAIPAADSVTTTPGQIVVVPAAVPMEGNFTTAIAIAVVTTLADAGASAPSTNIYCEILYK